MSPRVRCPPAQTFLPSLGRTTRSTSRPLLARASPLSASQTINQYATAVSAPLPVGALRLPEGYVPPTQPPSARRPEYRNSQLLRSYTSLLRSTPLILVFQHNNLTAVEWAAVRRELKFALSNVSGDEKVNDIASNIKLQVIRTRIFDVALKIVEYFDPGSVPPTPESDATAPVYNHDLSKAAYDAMKAASADPEKLSDPSSTYAQLSPLVVGPLAILTFPAVSPAHLAAALSVLCPNAPAFPPPSRRKSPGYYEPVAQSGLQKLLLVGGRIEGKVFDLEGVRWVGGIQGGLDGLRAQLVSMLQSAGVDLTNTLEAAGKSLWLTMESRKSVLEEEQKGDSATKTGE
ncbi:hypothetical protein VTK73DRAFT_6865 [Phialemonium thermophilum]|uniref:Ribosomal protein YmL11, mitochondrial n=1 Tax=Phialemonium thermophilum TaxID=223376 RepID=A0ABR3XVK1_9PEZI